MRWAALVLLVGCTKPSAPVPPPQPSDAPPPKVVAYDINLTLEPGNKAVALTLASRNGFHLNPDYPVNFKPSDSAVGFALKRYDLKALGERAKCAHGEDDCVLTASLPYEPTPGSTGEGTLAFSVCTPEQCLIEKVPVHVTMP